MMIMTECSYLARVDTQKERFKLATEKKQHDRKEETFFAAERKREVDTWAGYTDPRSSREEEVGFQ